MSPYQEQIKKVFGNSQGEELLSFWLETEVVAPVSRESSDQELRYKAGRDSLIIEIANILADARKVK